MTKASTVWGEMTGPLASVEVGGRGPVSWRQAWPSVLSEVPPVVLSVSLTGAPSGAVVLGILGNGSGPVGASVTRLLRVLRGRYAGRVVDKPLNGRDQARKVASRFA